MRTTYKIRKLTRNDLISVFQFYETTIPIAFHNEGLGHLTQEIHREIEHKKAMLEYSLSIENSDLFFLVALEEEMILGAISYGPPGNEIRQCMDETLAGINEIGSLYVLPKMQNQGIASDLIEAMKQELRRLGIDTFCLDSGYKHAQRKWLVKFGTPHKIVKDFWGKNQDHYIWIGKTG